MARTLGTFRCTQYPCVCIGVSMQPFPFRLSRTAISRRDYGAVIDGLARLLKINLHPLYYNQSKPHNVFTPHSSYEWACWLRQLIKKACCSQSINQLYYYCVRYNTATNYI